MRSLEGRVGIRVDRGESLLKDEDSGNPKVNCGKKATSHTDTGQRMEGSDSNPQASLKATHLNGCSLLLRGIVLLAARLKRLIYTAMFKNSTYH